MLRELDDGALARRVANEAGGASASEAEAELCRRFAPRVRAYGRRHLTERSRVDDFVQTVLVTVLAKLRSGGVDAPDAIASFMLGTCRRVASDARKMERRRSDLLRQTAPVLREAMTVELRTEALDRGRLVECLERLEHRARTVVLLAVCAELAGPEIATEVGTSPNNVRVIRHRALARLRICMDGGSS